MTTFIIALITGVAAGAFTAKTIVRRELAKQQPAPVPAPAPPTPERREEITPEILMVLTAAVAAFLGKRAKIRSARLAPVRPTSAWAQQGRVFVQASHNLPAPHGARQ